MSSLIFLIVCNGVGAGRGRVLNSIGGEARERFGPSNIASISVPPPTTQQLLTPMVRLSSWKPEPLTIIENHNERSSEEQANTVPGSACKKNERRVSIIIVTSCIMFKHPDLMSTIT